MSDNAPAADTRESEAPSGTASTETASEDGFWRQVGRRVVVGVVIVILIVGAAAAAPALFLPEQRVADGPTHAEWQPEKLEPTQLDAQGIPKPNGSVGTVVFDDMHNNRYDREDVSALTSAITRAGGDVQFTDTVSDLSTELEDADVFVVIDPARPYSGDEAATLEEFVDDGGRLIILGEPNRKSVQISGFAAVIGTERSRLTTLGSTFGISFGTEYVYDMERNDGNFKSPVVSAPQRVDHAFAAGLDEVAFYTPTTVSVTRGTVLLRTAPTAEAGTRDAKRGFAVAVMTKDEQVLAIGDASFLGNDVSSVGDNDVLIARMVEFMAGA